MLNLTCNKFLSSDSTYSSTNCCIWWQHFFAGEKKEARVSGSVVSYKVI